MPHGKWFLVVLSLAVFALCLAVACGGDGDGGGTATPGGGTATPGGSPTASATTNELQALSTEWEKTTAKVSYDVTSTSVSGTDKSTVTLYRSPPDWRMDISSSSQGNEILIVAGGAVYDCSTQTGADACISYDPSQVDVSAPLGIFDPNAVADNISGLNVDRSEETIAGEAATCFSVTLTTEGSTSNSRWCFASDGTLLQFTDTSDDPASANLTVEATSVNRNVTDADFDFTPPYPVTPYVPPASLTPSPESQAPASPTPAAAPASPTTGQ
jgi:outer membrane lipoprotein-sorting protein